MITSMTNPQAPQQLFLFTILALHVLTHIRSGQPRLLTSWGETRLIHGSESFKSGPFLLVSLV